MARGGAQRFAREGSILARLSHPHIARLLDAGVARDGAQPYQVLEYIDGLPIDRHCEQHGLDLKQRLQLFLDVLGAVAHAHSHLILHRDLKPSNILVTREGQVKLLDFGIAKLLDEAGAAGATELTQQAGRAFTPQYAAPEQLQGGDVTTATDVYALGVLLYVLLGGKHPTAMSTTTTPLDQMRAVIELEPKRLSEVVARGGNPRLARELRGDLDNIVAKALKKAARQRYAGAAEFAEDLRRYLEHEPVTARPDSAVYRVRKFVRRHWVGVTASTLAMTALAAGIAIALWQAREAQRQRVQAEGLIEFMLGDLRKKLQPVGRLDVLDAVGAKALAYYAQQADALDADSRGRRAQALHLIGQIALQQGKLDEASKVFEQAARATGDSMARHPEDGQRVFDHAQSVFWLGNVERKRGRLDETERSFREYLTLTERLAQLDPTRIEWRIERVSADINLGALLLERGQPQAALARLEHARDGWQSLAAREPELYAELARAWGWIADARESLGRLEDAVAAQQAKIDALRQLPNAATDRRAEHGLSVAEHQIGRLQLALGHPDQASIFAASALARSVRLLSQDPSNRNWQADTCWERLNLAEALWASDRIDEARALVAQASSDLTTLLRADPQRMDWQVTLQGRMLALSYLLSVNRHIEPLVAYLQRLPPGYASTDSEAVRAVASVELIAGDLLAPAAGARTHWASAQRRLESLPPSDLAAQAQLAQARLRLGQRAQAEELIRRIEASPYRHPQVADLRRRLAAAEGTASVR
jgi:serine/threonine-protein kinase